MTTQQEHLDGLATAFDTLTQALDVSQNQDPDLKNALTAVATHVRGLDLRRINDELASRIIEGTDKTVEAMARRARGGPGILTNRASINVQQVQDWTDKFFTTVFANYTQQKPAQNLLDIDDKKRNAFIALNAVVGLAQMAGLSKLALMRVVDSAFEDDFDGEDGRAMISLGVLHLFSLASNMGIVVEDTVAKGQANYQKHLSGSTLQEMMSAFPMEHLD